MTYVNHVHNLKPHEYMFIVGHRHAGSYLYLCMNIIRCVEHVCYRAGGDALNVRWTTCYLSCH